MKFNTRTRPIPQQPPSPALTVEDDPEYAAFDRRVSALDSRKTRLVARQIELEAQHPRAEPAPRLIREDFERAAADLLAIPPGPNKPLPTTLRGIAAERQLVERALERAADEGRVTYSAALDRVRKAAEPRW